jgi:hypothetical protein
MTESKRTISIDLRIRGQLLTSIQLSHLEYEEIRAKPLEEAFRHLIRKDPVLREDHRLSSLILEYLISGNYRVREAK